MEDCELDSTQTLRDSTVSDSPTLVDSVQQDSDEDEVFFGTRSSKEVTGKNAKFTRFVCLYKLLMNFD